MSYSLGQLIKRLEAEDPSKVVPLGLGQPHSYRGYYEDLEFTPQESVTVGEMLATARGCLGQTFTGYKGGEYEMHEYTTVWLGQYGNADGQSIGDILLDYMLGKHSATNFIGQNPGT